MIQAYEKKYDKQIERLLVDYSIPWGESASATMIAVENEKVIGIGSLSNNDFHPYRDYLKLFVREDRRRQGIGLNLFKDLLMTSKKKNYKRPYRLPTRFQ